MDTTQFRSTMLGGCTFYRLTTDAIDRIHAYTDNDDPTADADHTTIDTADADATLAQLPKGEHVTIGDTRYYREYTPSTRVVFFVAPKGEASRGTVCQGDAAPIQDDAFLKKNGGARRTTRFTHTDPSGLEYYLLDDGVIYANDWVARYQGDTALSARVDYSAAYHVPESTGWDEATFVAWAQEHAAQYMPKHTHPDNDGECGFSPGAVLAATGGALLTVFAAATALFASRKSD